MKKIVEDRVGGQKSPCDLSVNFLLFKGEKYVSKSLNKIRPQSPMEKLSRYLWSTLLFVYSPLTKNSAVDSLCQ